MVPEIGHTELSFSSFIILLGVVQGILLTIAGFVQRQTLARMKALLFFIITCIIAEIFLNRTGYMYQVIYLVDFSEPLQFAIAPLIYLIIVSLNPNSGKLKNWGWHFVPFIAYMIFFLPFYFAPASYKLESYYFVHHPVDWHSTEHFELLRKLGKFRMFQMQICFFQIIVYLVLSFQWLWKYKNKPRLYPGIDLFEIRWWFVFNAVMALLVVVILVVKVLYLRDLGDHIIASFFTLIIYFTVITELIRPAAGRQSISLVKETDDGIRSGSSPEKEEKKEEIKQKLIQLMEQKKLYTNSLISLSKISKQLEEPSYMVSQVINEKMKQSFYDWIAKYRVEEAIRLMEDPSASQYTIEQIAEEVGYNSKSAFNKAFKKFTGKTPSSYKQK